MKFGAYDQKIQFVSFGQESDGAGGYIPVETVELITFARIEQLRVRADIVQSRMKLPGSYRVRVMVRNGFSPVINMSVRWSNRVYQINTTPQVESVRLQKEWIFDITTPDNG